MYRVFLFAFLFTALSFITLYSAKHVNVNAAETRFVFPLSAPKSVITDGSSYNGTTMVWCYRSQENCHHDYNAADIFAVTGTKVVAAVSGKITQAHKTDAVGHTVHILGDDGKIYYHAHLGSHTVSIGQNVKAGDQIGTVGTAADAQNTPSHVHFDIIPNTSGYNGIRPDCGVSIPCTGFGFINPQPQLVAAFNAGTENGSGNNESNTGSNCWITKVGNPTDPSPTWPPECQSTNTGSGIQYPPNLQKCPGAPDGYYKMPDATDGSYKFYSTPNHHCGSKELIGVLYTVAKNWKQKYPQGWLDIGDMNAAGHASHKWGIASDINAHPRPDKIAANMTLGNYDQAATIVLGKMFVDTDMLAEIWYNDAKVNSEVLKYAKGPPEKSSLYKPTKACTECSKDVGGMRPLPLHDNHFHVDIDRDYLPDYLP